MPDCQEIIFQAYESSLVLNPDAECKLDGRNSLYNLAVNKWNNKERLFEWRFRNWIYGDRDSKINVEPFKTNFG